MRLLFDGVNAATVPAGSWAVAGYVNGEWPSYSALVDRFPSAVHLAISVNASGQAKILDVESGDAIPAQAPGWVADQRAAGDPYPVVYMNESSWQAVKDAFAAQPGIAPPLYWVASYVSDPAKPPAVPAGAIAIQYYDFGGYDVSAAADYWPGVDPEPPTPATVSEDDDMALQIEPLSVHPGEYAYAFAPDKTEFVLVADGYSSPPAQLRIVLWGGSGGNQPDVMSDVQVGGSSGVHTLGHNLPSGCSGVTVRRLDAQAYPVGIAFK